MSLLHPTLLKNRITDITKEDLRALGAKGLLLDVDNTLTTHGSQQLDPAVADWLFRMCADGFRLLIVSNATRKRVAPFAERLGLGFVSMACKPLPYGMLRACKRLRLSRLRCVMIGDQSLTDVLGARLCGMACIQVRPIRLEEGKPLMMWKRRLEGKILRRYEKQRGRG